MLKKMMPDRRRMAKSIDVEKLESLQEAELPERRLLSKGSRPLKNHMSSKARIKKFDEILKNFEEAQRQKVEKIRIRNGHLRMSTEEKQKKNQQASVHLQTARLSPSRMIVPEEYEPYSTGRLSASKQTFSIMNQTQSSKAQKQRDFIINSKEYTMYNDIEFQPVQVPSVFKIGKVDHKSPTNSKSKRTKSKTKTTINSDIPTSKVKFSKPGSKPVIAVHDNQMFDTVYSNELYNTTSSLATA